MMYNNGRQSRGRVLVGGLGLGLYLQYAEAGAAGTATGFTVVEKSPVVADFVGPTLHASLRVPVEVSVGEVSAYLSQPAAVRYDTIFLDTWETLDAVHLPEVNRLRDLALHHLAPGGQVLLWGYGWMVRLFEEACRQLLAVHPGRRREWLAAQAETSPGAVSLLTPVMDNMVERRVDDVASALAWCREYIVRRVAPV